MHLDEQIITGTQIHITGVVQGVGFRPFVYTLARRHGLTGWVRNTSEGVFIRADGSAEALRAFVSALQTEAPPLAHIDTLTAAACPPEAFDSFEIRESQAKDGAFQPISPDIALCPDCLRELRDPADRRYRYPFINCTNCGPRFTLIKDIPYDRPLTTMAAFPLCADCANDYHDPADRRFHAQPVACSDCGPHIWLESWHDDAAPAVFGAARQGDNGRQGDNALRATADLLRAGKIVAIKGVGGFHLACDATNPAAVAELRRRKHRVAKPFALMMPDLETIRRWCCVSEDEAKLLTSPASPIVLLRRADITDAGGIAPDIAPGQSALGVMLPYTPLHVLLFDEGLPPLVMTSGNHSEEPIVIANDDARARLSPLADAALMHDRDIHVRADDSVMRVFAGRELPVRRSRGYAPFPVRLPFNLPPLLAVGGEMKNTFCVTRDGYAFMSQHIGSMDNHETLVAFEESAAHFERLFRIAPACLVHDLHPDYLATRYALRRAAAENLPALAVQHHHAHIAAVLAEHGHDGDQPVIGVCFDGSGCGTDGTIWGGEFLIADYAGFERAAHLRPIRLPGGDAATRKPVRIALAYALAAGVDPEGLPFMAALSPAEARTIGIQMERGVNAPYTSSMGRLFDAVSALAGVCQTATYEGQAAIELEALIAPDEGDAYRFGLGERIDPAPVIQAAAADVKRGVPAGVIAARFHNGAALMMRDLCLRLADQYGLREVALSGGVFQNVSLLERALPLLRDAGLTVYTHQIVPPNDGGLALGQAVIAARKLG